MRKTKIKRVREVEEEEYVGSELMLTVRFRGILEVSERVWGPSDQQVGQAVIAYVEIYYFGRQTTVLLHLLCAGRKTSCVYGAYWLCG